MESEQHLLNLTTIELIRIIQDQKDEIERLQEELKTRNATVNYVGKLEAKERI